uniref:Ring finger protein 207a n=1 Tax=Gasterosteus aculeatus TaxID=69293 RepID=G3NK89_GASAC
MFSHHEIVSLAKRSKAKHRKCSLHEEPYILFSTENTSMLCIKCFRDMQVESRTHCIDIETAHMKGCEMLDRAVQVREAHHEASAGGEGAADLGQGGDRSAEGDDRRSVSECGGGRERDLLSVQQPAGKTGREEEDSAESSSESTCGEGESSEGAALTPHCAAANPPGAPRHLLGLPQLSQQV